MHQDTGTSPLVYARTVGFLYLVLLVVGPFSLLYVDGALVAPGDATTTANNIATSEFLFRLGLAGHGVTLLADLGIAVLLYLLFRPVNKALSMIALYARLGTAFLHAAIILLSLVVLLLVGDVEYFPGEQRDALVLLIVNMRQSGGIVWGMFFGLHCLLIGVLAYQSGYLPKWLGVLMIFPGVGYLLNSFGALVLPGLAELYVVAVSIGSIGEIIFVLWLLIKGVDVREWHLRAGQ